MAEKRSWKKPIENSGLPKPKGTSADVVNALNNTPSKGRIKEAHIQGATNVDNMAVVAGLITPDDFAKKVQAIIDADNNSQQSE